jgi:hypothetical protein
MLASRRIPCVELALLGVSPSSSLFLMMLLTARWAYELMMLFLVKIFSLLSWTSRAVRMGRSV